jgi:hypothetical protein
MSNQFTKTAGRSAKATSRSDKKTAKTARVVSQKASKSARRPVGKAVRPSTLAIRAPSIAPKVGLKSGLKAGLKSELKSAKMLRTSSPPVQPMAASEITVKTHRYQVGEMVYFTSPSFGRAASTGTYTVVKLLPSESDDYQYRIKSSGEAFERVAKESQLDRV